MRGRNVLSAPHPTSCTAHFFHFSRIVPLRSASIFDLAREASRPQAIFLHLGVLSQQDQIFIFPARPDNESPKRCTSLNC
jgi:hypothetical protein